MSDAQAVSRSSSHVEAVALIADPEPQVGSTTGGRAEGPAVAVFPPTSSADSVQGEPTLLAEPAVGLSGDDEEVTTRDGG